MDQTRRDGEAGGDGTDRFECQPAESWRALFDRIADGDPGALDELFDLAARTLYGLALWRTASAEDARDVVQEAFVRLAERRRELPPDDPLLLEAEPWCDQATMRFYPEVLPFEGLWKALPNLLVPLTFARSWAARGLADTDHQRALADFRRAIRLGRLVRQDDTTVIADLIGLECIRAGAEGIYTVATRDHDAELALVASLVLGEVAPQRLYSAERATRLELKPFASIASDGSLQLRPPASLVEDAANIARTDPDRRFRCEAMTTLGVIRFYGPPDQRATVSAVLDELAGDQDRGVAACAHWSREPLPPEDVIKGWYGLADE